LYSYKNFFGAAEFTEAEESIKKLAERLSVDPAAIK
jgi:hypothetical protein